MISSVDFLIIITVTIISLNGITCPAVQSQAAIDIPVKNSNGLIFPSEIDAIVGEDIYFKIWQPVADQTDCLYRRTGGPDVSIPTSTQPK